MEKNSIIKEIEKSIPDNYLYAIYNNGGKERTVKECIELIVSKKENVEVDKLISYIETKMYPSIMPLTESEVKNIKFNELLDEFINNKSDYIESIIINKDGDTIVFKDFIKNLVTDCTINADNKFEIVYKDPTTNTYRIIYRTIEEFYRMYLKNVYVEETLESKYESINYYVNEYINYYDDITLLDEIYKDGKTLKQFFIEELPNIMTDSISVEYLDDNNIVCRDNIDVFIRNAVEKVYNRKKEFEITKEEEIIDINNHVNDRPFDVQEIKEYDIGNQDPIDKDDFIMEQINKIKESINKCVSFESLELVEDKFNTICYTIEEDKLYKYNDDIAFIRESIKEKQNNLIIRNNNKNDYVNSIVEKLINIKSDLNNVESEEVLTGIIEEVNTMEIEYQTNGLYNRETNKLFEEVNSIIESKRYKFNTLKESKPLYEKTAEIDLNSRLIEIDKEQAELSTVVDNRLAAAKSEKINRLIVNYNYILNEYYKDGLISEEDMYMFNNKLDDIVANKGGNYDERRI